MHFEDNTINWWNNDPQKDKYQFWAKHLSQWTILKLITEEAPNRQLEYLSSLENITFALLSNILQPNF